MYANSSVCIFGSTNHGVNEQTDIILLTTERRHSLYQSCAPYPEAIGEALQTCVL